MLAESTTPVWPIPSSLSPSRVSSFTSCPMQFRFSSVQRLPEPPGVATTRGSVVHRALELLFVLPAAERTPEALASTLTDALDEYSTDPDYVGLHLDDTAATKFRADCEQADRALLRHGGPHDHPRHRPRSPDGGQGRFARTPRHHRPTRARRRRRTRRHRLQDRTGPVGQLRAEEPRRASTSTRSCARRCSANGRRRSG